MGLVEFIERAVSPQRAIPTEILPATEPAEGKSIVISRAPTGKRGTIGMKLRLRYEATASTPDSKPTGHRPYAALWFHSRGFAAGDDLACMRLYEGRMRTALFDFELPPDRIALRPVAPRDAARLLVVRPGGTPDLEDRGVGDLPDLLRRGDALVVNDTKVIAARLRGRRIGRGAMEPAIEATLHQRLDGSRWRAFVKPAKRLSPGDVVRFGDEGKVCFLGQLDATVEAKAERGEVTLAFAFHGPVLD